MQQTVLGVFLAIAIISTDAKLFHKKKWLPLIGSGFFGFGGDHGGFEKEEITVERPKIVEIVKHVPVIQKVEVIKPVEIIRTVQVPGKK